MAGWNAHFTATLPLVLNTTSALLPGVCALAVNSLPFEVEQALCVTSWVGPIAGNGHDVAFVPANAVPALGTQSGPPWPT